MQRRGQSRRQSKWLDYNYEELLGKRGGGESTEGEHLISRGLDDEDKDEDVSFEVLRWALIYVVQQEVPRTGG